MGRGMRTNLPSAVCWPDGSIRWNAGHGSVELDGSGKPPHARGDARHTQAKEAEDELGESEARFRTLADGRGR